MMSFYPRGSASCMDPQSWSEWFHSEPCSLPPIYSRFSFPLSCTTSSYKLSVSVCVKTILFFFSKKVIIAPIVLALRGAIPNIALTMCQEWLGLWWTYLSFWRILWSKWFLVAWSGHLISVCVMRETGWFSIFFLYFCISPSLPLWMWSPPPQTSSWNMIIIIWLLEGL